jgi:Xaa-Pro aminopeptidase
MNATQSIYAQRRARLASMLGAGGIAIIPTAPERPRNRDTDFIYRHDSYFYYLTGFAEPGAVLVLTAEGHSTLFCQPKDLEREIWDGYRLGPAAAPEALGVNAAQSSAVLDAQLPRLLENRSCVWYPFATHTGLAARVEGWLNAVRARVRYGALCPAQQSDVCTLLDEMRLIKDAHELDIMRRASQISAQAHIRAMQRSARMLRAGQDVREYHLDAELLHAFREGGSQYPAYGSIVAAGANACVLHYRADAAPVRDGELVLIDAGCELDGYASDITRTFPANGKFTAPQRALYDLVLASQDAAVAATKAGARFNDPHDATVAVLAQGLLDLGLLDKNKVGTAQDVIDQTCLLPVLHAPHRPLAGHGCARLRQLRGARRGGPGQRTQGPALGRDHHQPPQPRAAPRHGADHRAWAVRAPRRGRAGAVLEHWHPHRGRCRGDRGRL